ncbi:MAG TPA: FAD-binding oxidoreductase [Hypericibacter adhaerens]|uniref:NAD(P)/FAD-dependent oxidoreductase n=1 Tax=Hypericibacter adhaerens TaxID=2602016 RepID=UPI002C3E1507|nr:FAD-binding oxidoreductase [Hypericibacter adhaerens]HWA45471.1 FAD-binding oxidoreductase [Hypericibacter adhaerens]
MTTAKPRTIVIGAGIVGASVAYHLARRGAPVTLIDKGKPAGAVTGKAFAWINVAHGLPEPYSQLRHLAVQDWRRLEQELERPLPIDWCGALTWNRDPADTERLVREHAAWGYDIRLVERPEIARLEPNLTEPPAIAAFAASEAAVDPVAATTILADAARRAGAELRLETEVGALATKSGKISGIRTRDGIVSADRVVIAAGIEAPALCRTIDLALPVETSPALLLRFKTAGRLVNRILTGPVMEVRQASPVQLLAAEDYVDAAGENGPEAIAQRTLAAVRRHLRAAEGTTLESVSVGLRPMPADGLPIVGAGGVEGLYLAVMHAGVTLAPLVGRLAASEILDGVEVRMLESCRLARFSRA